VGEPKRIATLCGTLVLCCTSAIAQGANEAAGSRGSLRRPAAVSPATDLWVAWHFLLGEWTAEGGGAPGQGTRTFSFQFDLQGKVLIRKNRSDYPATKDHPAFSHEDLMIVYAEPGAKGTQAVYFDSEGHVIHYTAEFTADQESLVFLSDLLPSSPRYRLTYTKAKERTLKIKFESAPADKPQSFATYLEASAHRK
jgi:hypothetical protein